MCKTRLQIIDPVPNKDSKNIKENKSYISMYDITSTEDEIKSQMIESENRFIRILGRIKYLKHLEKRNEPDACPICTKKPENRYAVLQCGHIMCLICLYQMEQYQKTHLICCVCRLKQKNKDIFYATVKASYDNQNDIFINGEYSTKIETILKTIKKLCKDDENVKIIIFSQWESILNTLASALKENSINFQKKSSKIHICIENFKNSNMNITCLLLPLQFGSKGLNLIEATHVFFVEPILNQSEELQAIGRVHRIGQTRKTYVHKFITKNTIEETIFNTITKDENGKWRTKQATVENLKELFYLHKDTTNLNG